MLPLDILDIKVEGILAHFLRKFVVFRVDTGAVERIRLFLRVGLLQDEIVEVRLDREEPGDVFEDGRTEEAGFGELQSVEKGTLIISLCLKDVSAFQLTALPTACTKESAFLGPRPEMNGSMDRWYASATQELISIPMAQTELTSARSRWIKSFSWEIYFVSCCCCLLSAADRQLTSF